MLTDTASFEHEECNPLDSLETVFDSYNWVFNRTNDEELFVKLTGKSTEYDVYFVWDDAMNILQLHCNFNIHIAFSRRQDAWTIVSQMNEHLHIGHFSLNNECQKPVFKYNTLVKHLDADQARNLINEIFDLCLAQCEKCASAFSLLSDGDMPAGSELDLALMEVQGQS